MKTSSLFKPQSFLAAALVVFAALLAQLTAPTARASTYYWDNSNVAGFGTASGGTWASTGTTPTSGSGKCVWTTDNTGASNPSSIVTSTSDTLNFATASLSLGAGTVTVSGATAVQSGSMNFNAAAGAIVLASASSGNITFATAPTITVNNASDTINTPVGGAATSLTKAGSGILNLGGAVSHSGTTAINAGTLALTTGGTLPNTPSITIASGATFDVSAPTTALALGASQTLKASATGANTTATVTTATGKSLTLGGTTTGLEFTAYGGGATAPLTVASGTGGGLLLNSKPILVTTTAALGAGPYKLVAKSGSATVAQTPGTLTVAGSSLASGATGTLSVSSGELFLTISYTVTFNSNGGSAVSSQSVNYNATASTPTAPTLTGNTFAGWYSDVGLTTPFVFSTAITGPTTLYAKWTPINYTVSYNLNGGTGTTPSTQNGDYNTSITVATGAGFSRSGFVFTGWNTVAVGGGTAAASGGSYTIPANNSTLFAQWTAAATPTKLTITAVPSGTTPAGNTFSVTVQAQDDSGNPGNVILDTGVSLAASGSGTLAGNTATITSGSGSVTLTGVTYTKAEAITLTASATSGDALTNGAASSSFTVGPGAANAANSTAVASPASVAADNSTTSTVTVTLQDAYNNVLGAGTNVSWSATGTGNTLSPASSGTTSSSGVATFTVKSVKAETKTVTVNVGATVITNLLQITFTAAITGNSFTWDISHNTTGSDGAGTWDTTTANWANSSADFAWPNNGNDNATFGTGAALSASRAITLGTPITVSNLTFNTSGANQYTLGNEQTITLAGTPNISVAGAATISGTLAGTGFTKIGSGTLTLSGANPFSGTVTMNAGTLSLGNVDALTSVAGITLAGGTTLTTILTPVTIAAPITLGTVGTTSTVSFSTNATGTGTYALNGLISGAGNLTFTTPSGSAGVSLQTVSLGLANTYGGNTLFTTGNSASQLTVQNGVANALPVTTVLTVNGGNGSGSGRTVSYELNGYNQTIAGLTNISPVTSTTVGQVGRNQRVNNAGALATLTISNNADFTFGYPGLTNTFNGNLIQPRALITGAIALTKIGPATQTLISANTYTGDTTVSEGTLALGAFTNAAGTITVGSIGSSPNIIVGTAPGSAAILDVTVKGITIGGGQTLKGHGTVNGTVTVNGTLAPGTSIGVLTNTVAPVLNGTVLMEVNTASSPTSDKLVLAAGAGALTYGGTLTVTNLGPWPANGTVFDLFDADSFSGSFTSVTAGQHWDTNNLIVDGTIAFTNNPPTVTNLSLTNTAGLSVKIKKSDVAADIDGDALTFTFSVTNGTIVEQDATYIKVQTNAVTDQITFTVTDGFGGTNTGTVHLALATDVYGGGSGNVSTTSTNATALLSGIPYFWYTAQRGTNADFSLGVTNFTPAVQAGTNGVVPIVDDFGDLFGTPNINVPANAYYRLKYDHQ